VSRPGLPPVKHTSGQKSFVGIYPRRNVKEKGEIMKISAKAVTFKSLFVFFFTPPKK